MKTMIGTISVGAGKQATAVNMLVGFVAWVKSISWRLKRQRSRIYLSELTDDQLRDIGLSRSQAMREAEKSLFE